MYREIATKVSEYALQTITKYRSNRSSGVESEYNVRDLAITLKTLLFEAHVSIGSRLRKFIIQCYNSRASRSIR